MIFKRRKELALKFYSLIGYINFLQRNINFVSFCLGLDIDDVQQEGRNANNLDMPGVVQEVVKIICGHDITGKWQRSDAALVTYFT